MTHTLIIYNKYIFYYYYIIVYIFYWYIIYYVMYNGIFKDLIANVTNNRIMQINVKQCKK